MPIIELVASIVAAGLVTGLLAGLFGVSGGGVIVPVLFEVFGLLHVPDLVRMHLSVGTSLAIIVPISIRSYRAHAARMPADKRILRIWALPAIAGVASGSLVAAFTTGNVLKISFISVSSLIAIKLLLGRDTWRIQDSLPNDAVMTVYGYGLGLIAALIGVGGAAMSTALLTLHRKPIHEAIGVSAGIGVPITIAGTLGYAVAGWRYNAILPPFSLGYVSLAGVALMAPVSMLITPYGAALAHRLSKRPLEIGFAIYLLASCVRFAIQMLQ